MTQLNQHVKLFAALAILLCGSLVDGSTITATFRAVDSGTNMHFYRNAYGQTVPNEFVSVGAYRWDGDAGNESPWNVSGFHTFCIDFVQNINFNVTYVFSKIDLEDAPQNHGINTGNPPAGMGASKADGIKTLWAVNYNSLGTDPAKVAGFQMAIWELIYEGESQTLLTPSAYNVTTTTGSGGKGFKTTEAASAATGYAATYLASIFSSGALRTDVTLANLAAFASNDFQDQVVLAPGEAIEAAVVVPLPSAASAGIVIVAFAGLTKLRRRYAQQ